MLESVLVDEVRVGNKHHPVLADCHLEPALLSRSSHYLVQQVQLFLVVNVEDD